MEAILEEAKVALKEGISSFDEPHSFELDWYSPVGWSSTDDWRKYPLEALEKGVVGRTGQATALFVRSSSRFLAPLTTLITIAFTLGRHPKEGTPFITIRTIYPGPDVGELGTRNVSEEEEVVFFRWTHMGEPIAATQPAQSVQMAQA